MTRFAALGALCIAALAYDAHVASAATTDIHVVTTLCGSKSMTLATPMLRSLLWFRSAKVVIHAIADASALKSAQQKFANLRVPHAEFHLIDAAASPHAQAVRDALKARGQSSGAMDVCRGLRLFAASMVPEEVEHAVVLSSSGTVVLGDVMDLWAHSRHFDKSQLFGAALEQTRAYKVGKSAGAAWDAWAQVYEAHGVDGGVMLLNVAKMREKKWQSFVGSLLKSPAFAAAPPSGKHSLEQDVYNYAMLKHGKRSRILYKLPCNWNVNLHPTGLCTTGMEKPGMPRLNCTCLPPRVYRGDTASLKKNKLGSFYAFWRDTPPDTNFHFAPRPADARHGEPLIERGAGTMRYSSDEAKSEL